MLGMACIIAELFVPGGVLGVVGFVCLVTAVLVGYDTFERPVANALLVLLASGSLLGFVLWVRYFPTSRAAKPFVVSETSGRIPVGYRAHLGREGVAVSDLRPSGRALFKDDHLDVVAEGAFIPKGTPVKVIQADGNRLVVRALGGNPAES